MHLPQSTKGILDLASQTALEPSQILNYLERRNDTVEVAKDKIQVKYVQEMRFFCPICEKEHREKVAFDEKKQLEQTKSLSEYHDAASSLKMPPFAEMPPAEPSSPSSAASSSSSLKPGAAKHVFSLTRAIAEHYRKVHKMPLPEDEAVYSLPEYLEKKREDVYRKQGGKKKLAPGASDMPQGRIPRRRNRPRVKRVHGNFVSQGDKDANRKELIHDRWISKQKIDADVKKYMAKKPNQDWLKLFSLAYKLVQNVIPPDGGTGSTNTNASNRANVVPADDSIVWDVYSKVANVPREMAQKIITTLHRSTLTPLVQMCPHFNWANIS